MSFLKPRIYFFGGGPKRDDFNFIAEKGISRKTASAIIRKLLLVASKFVQFHFSSRFRPLPTFLRLILSENPLIHDVRALVFDLPTATADYNFEKGVALLNKALSAFQPVQSFANLAAFLAYFRHHPHLTIDVTEIYTQRPKDKSRQKEIYSGKKNGTPTKSSL